MLLSEAITNIKSGDLIVWANETDFIDKVITLWEDSPYDHVAVAYWSNNTLMFAQAGSVGGVYMVPAIGAGITDHTGTCYWVDNKLTWNAQADSILNSAIGQPYSYVAEVEVGFDLTPAANKYICSTYAAQILKPLGIDISLKGCTPKVVVETCVNRGGILTPVTQG